MPLISRYLTDLIRIRLMPIVTVALRGNLWLLMDGELLNSALRDFLLHFSTLLSPYITSIFIFIPLQQGGSERCLFVVHGLVFVIDFVSGVVLDGVAGLTLKGMMTRHRQILRLKNAHKFRVLWFHLHPFLLSLKNVSNRIMLLLLIKLKVEKCTTSVGLSVLTRITGYK